jgi:hypothetical protein
VGGDLVTSKNAHSTGGVCVTCNHPQRVEIDAQLVAWVPLRQLVKQYGMSISMLSNHRTKHISKSLTALHLPHPPTEQSSRSKLENDIARIEASVNQAQEEGRPAQFEKSMALLLRAREMLAKLEGPRVIAVDVQSSEEWGAIRTVIGEVLAQYPDLRATLAKRLQEIDRSPSANGAKGK